MTSERAFPKSSKLVWRIEVMNGFTPLIEPYEVPIHHLSDHALARALQVLAARYEELTAREIIQSHQRGSRDGLLAIHRDITPERHHVMCVCGDTIAIAKRLPAPARVAPEADARNAE